jgi:uncharacterized protein YhbP (UPF0306 family)
MFFPIVNKRGVKMGVESYLDEKDFAKKLIVDNKYMVVATSNPESKPWAAPVLYVYDESYAFYFLSAIDSLHAKNILGNPQVCLSIFNSEQPIGKSDGIQIEALAHVVDKTAIEGVINIYCRKLFPESNVPPLKRYRPEDYLEPSEFRFFVVKPTKVYVTDGLERRVEVDLSE